MFFLTDPNKIDFAAFRGIDTCVFLMAGKSLELVCTRLVSDADKRGDTPVAVIRDACGRSETIYRGTLETIVKETNGEKLSPCVVVVGSMCSLGDVYDPNAEGVVSLGGDLEPGTIDVGGDNTATIDDSYADSYIDNLTRAIEAKDARIRTLEEELGGDMPSEQDREALLMDIKVARKERFGVMLCLCSTAMSLASLCGLQSTCSIVSLLVGSKLKSPPVCSDNISNNDDILFNNI